MLKEAADIFSRRREKEARSQEELEAELYRQIGQLKVELDWLKKKLSGSVEEKRAWIEPEHREISVVRQCDLIGLSRSSYYYQPSQDSAFDDQLMRLIDEEYTRHPYYGSRRIRACLQRQGYAVNRKRIQRLMGRMGIAAIYPKPGLSQAVNTHQKFPYLL